MTIQLTKIAGIGAVLAALTAAPAVAQDIAEWDADLDGVLDDQEFGEGWSAGFDDEGGGFGAWDGDGDGALTEDEFNTGVFNSYDRDGSGVIEEVDYLDVSEDMAERGLLGD